MESPPPARPWRPTRAELEAADGRAIPDVIARGLKVLFCGINPGRYSGATGRHFARPGNRFWPTLEAAGFTYRLLTPWDGGELLQAGFGITNLVNRTTATAAELSSEELREGAARLLETAEHFRPACVAILGISAYRIAFDRPKAAMGPQPEPLGPSSLWILPNPSGLKRPLPAAGPRRGLPRDARRTRALKTPLDLDRHALLRLFAPFRELRPVQPRV